MAWWELLKLELLLGSNWCYFLMIPLIKWQCHINVGPWKYVGLPCVVGPNYAAYQVGDSWPTQDFYRAIHFTPWLVGFDWGMVCFMSKRMSNVSFATKYFLPQFPFSTRYNLPYSSIGLNAIGNSFNVDNIILLILMYNKLHNKIYI